MRGIGDTEGKGVRLITVGRLVPEKGIAEMVETFKKLRQKYPNLEFTVVGSGPLKNVLDVPGITRLSNVKFADMPEIYSSADIYLHYPIGSKTWLEQYGFVLVEAMACGLPVVALDKGSTREVVGDGGRVVSAGEFGPAVENLIKNTAERKSLAITALEYAKKNYDVRNYSRNLEKIFLKELSVDRPG